MSTTTFKTSQHRLATNPCLEDDGSGNMRVKVDGTTIQRTASGLAIVVPQVLSVATSDSNTAGASTTSEIDLTGTGAQYTFAANTLAANQVYRFTASGRYTWGAGTMTLRAYLGSGGVLYSNVFTPTGNGNWRIDALLYIATGGSGGTFRSNSTMLGTTGGFGTFVLQDFIFTQNVNTTVSNLCKLTVQFGTSNGSNGLVMYQKVLERLA